MPEIFQFDFMQKAFITGILIAIITPCIGTIVVLRRLSMIGDSLSHSSLAGVTAGLIAGVNPILGAIIFSIAAAFGIERVRKSFPKYSEIAIAVIMSTGIGLAGVLSGFVKNSATFNSFLFGSIMTISSFELTLVVVLSLIVIITLLLLYKELFYITFDEESAKIAGVPLGSINIIFTLLTAITISVSARTVGTLVVSSLMVLPVAASLQVSKSYKQTYIYAILFALIATISGLFISYYIDLKPGGTIVLVTVVLLVGVLTVKNVFQKMRMQKSVKAGI